MKIKSIKVNRFRRFEDLQIDNLPPAKLVVLAGPNGIGKSSLFDAFSTWYQANQVGLSWDPQYHSRSNETYNQHVRIEFHAGTPSKKTFYFRSAYRNDPEFQIQSLQRQVVPTEDIRVRRMIDSDGTVSSNYQRLASNAFENAFSNHSGSMTLEEFREQSIGEISRAVARLFPDLKLHTLGNPLQDGTFSFAKGEIQKFSYKNLSSGEKAAFDLLLDFIIKKKTYDDTIYVIDEPEAHINTRLQGALLRELYDLIPEGSQLWISTHSIGMMRHARHLYQCDPSNVVFLDLEGHNFDKPTTLAPVVPSRVFWERVLRVALDDLAELVAPKQVVICEGNPKVPTPGKNEEHDARCYNTIFAEEFPETKFVSGGNSHDVAADRLKFSSVVENLVSGISVLRLIDGDDHSPQDKIELQQEGIRSLTRRHLESYLFDDEILDALCNSLGKQSAIPDVRAAKTTAIATLPSRGKPPNDIKSAAPQIYVSLKSILGLTGSGNDYLAFSRQVLAPLVKSGTSTYEELKGDIFGNRGNTNLRISTP
jgi:predicted ATPase